MPTFPSMPLAGLIPTRSLAQISSAWSPRTPVSFVTDAGVLQELVHRSLAQDRWAREVIKAVALGMQDRIELVYAGDILSAADLAGLADRHPGISARDLVHAAVMLRLEVEQVVSANTDFDRLPGVARLDPSLVWRRTR